jgi:4-amino-4-deoxy-L-arabinose transferase-like glycosyltransferase
MDGYEGVFRPPGYSMFIYLLFHIHKSPEVVYISNLLLGGLLLFLIYKLGDMIFNNGVAKISLVIGTIYLPLILHTRQFVRLNLLTPILITILLILINIHRSNRHYYKLLILSGFLLGYTMLIRGFVLMFSLILIICLYFSLKKFSKYIKSVLIIIFMIVVVMSPWVIRNYIMYGCFIPVSSNSAFAFLGSNNEAVIEYPELHGKNIEIKYLKRMGYFTKTEGVCEEIGLAYKTTFKFLSSNIDKIPYLIYYKFTRFWDLYPEFDRRYERIFYSINFIPVLLFALYGMYLSAIKRIPQIWVFFCLIMALQISVLIYFGIPRLRNPIEPLLVLFAGYGIQDIYYRLKGLKRNITKDNR